MKETNPDFLATVKKKSMSGAISYFLRTLVLQGIGLVSVAILSAYFSPEDFGIYGFVIQIIGILLFVSDVGLAASLIQKQQEPTENDYKTVFTVQQLLSWGIVGIIICILLTEIVQEKTGSAGMWILLSLGFSFPLASLKTIPSIILERKLDFSKVVIPQIFEQLVFHGLLIFLAIQGMGALAYAFAVFARSLIGVVVMLFIQPWKISLGIDMDSLRSLLGFGVKFQLNDFLARIKDQLFFLFVAFLFPLREFGYIQWAKNWSLYPYQLTVQNVMAITFPTFSRLQDHTQLLSRALEKTTYLVSLLIFPILVGMCIFVTPFINLFPVYEKWLPAVASLIFFTLSTGWSAVINPLVNALNAVGKIDKTLKLMVAWATLTWLVTPVFVYLYGYNGVAIAAFVVSFSSLLALRYIRQVVTFSFMAQVWRPFVAALCMAGFGIAGSHLWGTNLGMFIVGGMLSVLIYGLVNFALGPQKLLSELKSLKTAL